jgi:hypothetical protein
MATATKPSAPAPWAIDAVLGYLSKEADHHADIAKRLRNLGDVDRQTQIVHAIEIIRDMAATNFAAS